jgi:predicted GIY-YIG superfamily endonuclease
MADKRFLYILKEQGTEFYRVGITHSINYRIGTLTGGNHRKLQLKYMIEFDSNQSALNAENQLHELLKEFTTDPKKRSWYELTGNRLDMAKKIIDMMINEGIIQKKEFVL